MYLSCVSVLPLQNQFLIHQMVHLKSNQVIQILTIVSFHLCYLRIRQHLKASFLCTTVSYNQFISKYNQYAVQIMLNEK